MIIVTLTAPEIMQAGLVGLMRQCQNIKMGREHAHGFDGANEWQVHIEGACGELAVAKHLGKFWCGNIGDLKADDVGPLQVRTAAQDHYRLILHESDPDDKNFVLVTGRCPAYRLRGWIRCVDGKLSKYWEDPATGRPAFFVPTRSLSPMNELM